MRGMIPAQILIILAAVLAIEQATALLQADGKRRWVWTYLFILFLVAQGLSSASEIRANSIYLLRWLAAGKPINQTEKAILDYIHWLNANTPSNALVIEQGCPVADPPSYRWLERQRLLSPACADSMNFFERDRDFTLLGEWRAYQQHFKQAGILDAWDFPQYALETLDISGKGGREIYQVVWQVSKPAGLSVPEGEIVYSNEWVTISRIR